MCFEQALDALRHLPPRRDLLEQAIDLRFALRNACAAVGALGEIADHLREAQATAEGLGDRLRLGWVLAYRTSSDFLLGENDRAMESGERAVAIAGALAEPRLRIAAHLYYGQTCHAVGQYQRGADLMRRSIEALESELTSGGEKPPQQTYSRALLLCCLAELGDFAEGLARGEEAMRFAEAADRGYALSHVCFALGLLQLRRGEFRSALPVLQRGLSLCEGRDTPLLAAALGSLLGYAYSLSGDLAKAIPLLENSIPVLSDQMHAEAQPVTFLGEAHLLGGRVEEARTLARRAVALSRDRAERGYEAWALRLLAETASYDAPGDAEVSYGSALARAEELGMLPLRAHCHLGRGRLRLRSGDRDGARADLSAAVDIFRSRNMSLWLPAAEAELGQTPAPGAGTARMSSGPTRRVVRRRPA